MIKAIKDLPAVNDEIRLDNPTDKTGHVSFQYLSGAGTVVVEASHDGIVWFALLLTSMTTAATTAAAFTAVGGWYTLCPFEFVRARKSVGALACSVALAFAPF